MHFLFLSVSYVYFVIDLLIRFITMYGPSHCASSLLVVVDELNFQASTFCCGHPNSTIPSVALCL